MVICDEDGCKRNAGFNYRGNPPLFCRPHKKDGMININRLCICYNKRPCFNYEYEKKALYCKDCKLDGMIDVINKKCTICNIKRPSFNYSDEKKGLYCDDCKLDGMIDVEHLKCTNCNKKRPCFNYEYEKKALYCKDCKLDEMIDIVNKKCIVCNNTRPCFNYENEKNGLYCDACKLDGMINVITKKCIECNIKQPSFNYENEKNGLYCDACKLDRMINVIDKKCIVCKITQLSHNNYNYQEHCLRCFIYTFPDNKISRNYKIKESYVQEFIKEEFSNEFDFDKTIDGGCSKRRPDAFKDCLTHIVIIEIDEYQHRNYEEICENKRMMEIFGDTNNRPIIFIRFNPDSYIDKNNNKIKSSFKMHKKLDVPIIRNPIEWRDRLIKLKEIIEYHICNIPEKTITIEKLFYDQNI
jgi:EsV-1-7 cysteine-rich motif